MPFPANSLYEPWNGYLSMRVTSVIRLLSPKHGTTDSVTVVVVLSPPTFCAVIVYVLSSLNSVATPEIMPV